MKILGLGKILGAIAIAASTGRTPSSMTARDLGRVALGLLVEHRLHLGGCGGAMAITAATHGGSTGAGGASIALLALAMWTPLSPGFKITPTAVILVEGLR